MLKNKFGVTKPLLPRLYSRNISSFTAKVFTLMVSVNNCSEVTSPRSKYHGLVFL